MRRRQGAVLAIVGALILVVAIGTFMLQRVMRQRYLEAHRYTYGEIALNLAESGINLALEKIREESLSPGTPFHQLLVERGYDELDGETEAVPAPFLDALVELLGDSEAAVHVEFRNFRPFYPATGLRGIRPDAREKYGELAVVSRASFRGVTRTLVASRQVKVVNVTAPVLSKFTLFLRSRGGQDPNLIEYDRRQLDGGFSSGGAPARPLVVYNHPEPLPAVVDGRFDSLSTVFSEFEPDAGGLVFLGGDEPWYLNLVHGAGASPYEELFLLRRTRYRMPSELSGVTSEYGLTFGFYRGIFGSSKFGSASGDPGSFPRPTGGTVTAGTSALHLYGDVNNVTPAPVLGPVYRSFVTLRLLDGLWYPYRDAGEFAGASFDDPDQPDPFGGDYAAYAEVMTRVEHESYNRGFDYIVTNSEELVDGGRVVARETPFIPPGRLVESALSRVGPAVGGDEYFLYPEPEKAAPGMARIRRHGADGAEDVFVGALADIDGDLMETVVTARATFAAEDVEEFRARFLDGTEVREPGILWLKQGELELEGLTASRGVMLVVDGNLTVKGAVTPGEGAGPITLVSLNGDVRLQTSERVQAHLVALRGRVLSRGRLEVAGGVAAESLDLENLIRGAQPKSLTYDPALDYTDADRYRAQLQVAMDPRIRLHLEGH